MQGMFLNLDRSKRTRFPFTSGQLGKIFASPLFSECMGDEREHESGKIKIRDWRYWIPLIALYSGARLDEIAQLLVADVRESHRTWIFHITTEGEGEKSTKTDGSRRVIPIHSELIRIGLLDYHSEMVALGYQNPFLEIEPDGRGYMSGNPSAFFNDYFAAVNLKEDKRVNFITFATELPSAFREAGYLDE